METKKEKTLTALIILFIVLVIFAMDIFIYVVSMFWHFLLF
nr:MAG TPA: hypothetical protein [Caudoviricetes sp.]